LPPDGGLALVLTFPAGDELLQDDGARPPVSA
jgi:hypothetical protein